MLILNKRTIRVVSWTLFPGIAASWIVYGFFGRSAIDFLYYNSAASGIADRVMSGRGSTPIEAYYRFGDRIVFGGALTVATVYLVLLAIVYKPAEVFLARCSTVVTSLLLFSFFEMFPSLIEPFHLHAISYYAYKATFVDDETLAFRENPSRHIRYDNFRGDHYSPIYGVQVRPTKVE